MKCAHCSTPIPDNSTYCFQCGSLVSDAEGQAAATAALDDSGTAQLKRMLQQDTQGQFEIGQMLGKGGMALVYLAREIDLERKVAIKVLPPELTFGHGVARFKREAKVAAALDHPNIIPIYRIASEGKLFWYAMKFLEGQSLEQYLKEHTRLSLEETIEFLEPVAKALDYAHSRQVIHRDIKPANVMVDAHRHITVTDFGIAKALTEGTLTASGSIIGTPFYMSPEQGMGKPVTGASDQYSVAVMAYRMLAGQVPFEGDSAIDVLRRHCSEPPPPLDVLRPGLPTCVYAAIHKALAKPPHDRFSGVAAFVKGLQSMSPEISAATATLAFDTDATVQTANAAATPAPLADEPTKVVDPPRPRPGPLPITQPAVRRFRMLGVLAPVVAVLAGGGIALGLWLTGRDRPDEPPPVVEEQPSAPGPESLDDPVRIAQRGAAAVQPPEEVPVSAPVRTEPAAQRPAPTPPPAVASVRLTPGNARVTVGETARFDATPLDAGGERLGGQPILWRSDDPAIVSVAADGTVRGLRAGSTTVTATARSGGASGRARIVVVDPAPPPQPVARRAEPAAPVPADHPFAYTLPAGWSEGAKTDPSAHTYKHPDHGTIEVRDLTASHANSSREAILEHIQSSLGGTDVTVRAEGGPEEIVSAGGATVLLRRLQTLSVAVGGFEDRRRVIVAVVKNGVQVLGFVGSVNFYVREARGRAEQELLQMLRALQ